MTQLNIRIDDQLMRDLKKEAIDAELSLEKYVSKKLGERKK